MIRPVFAEYETMRSVIHRQGESIGYFEVLKRAEGFGRDSPDWMRSGIEAVAFGDQPPPRFKVYPDILQTLASCEFRINGADVKWPFPHFLVSLPINNDLRHESAVQAIHNILVFNSKDRLSCLIQSEKHSVRPDKPTGQFRFVIDADRPIETQIVEHCRNIDLRKPEFEHPRKFGFTDEILLSSTLGWFRVCVGVALLATSGDKLVERDVLSKDLHKYIEAKRAGNANAAAQIQDRCERRRHHASFTVGGESFRPLYSSADRDSEATGRELTHQHMRRAHFRKLSSEKVVFVRHAVIRPDLPAAGRQPIYNID